jgi:hypothetical protein
MVGMKIYLERQYNHRYFDALIGSIVLIAMGGVTLWGLLGSLGGGKVPEFSVGFMLFAPLLAGGAGLFVYAGGALVYGWLTDRTDRLTITAEGIGHFGKFSKWDEIKCLSCGCKRTGELMLFYQRKGFGFDRFLPVTEPLSAVGIETLFRELKTDLQPRFRKLRIG